MAAMATAETPPLPWHTRLLVRAVNVLHSASLRRDGTVNRFLLSLFDRHVPPNPTPDSAGVFSSDHAVSDHLRVRLFFPSTPEDAGGGGKLPVVVYFHGGGFVFHSASSARYDALCRRLAAAIPAVVASVDYRLAPEHKFPAPYDDGEAAIRWVHAGAGGALMLPPTAVFVAGDSAGGNVAHHAAARVAAVAGVVLVQPFFGGETATASERQLRDAPFASPERIAQREYADALRDAGGGEEVVVAEFPDAIHGFYILDDLDDSKRLLDEVADFVNRHHRAASTSAS
uniref:Alpha/beta hydrolase fold-3 domain-containing protein n=1 Tax=Leersia perrieri TaxID=77586 RepID=A0A0D9X1B0_9ORYZ